ncbi:MAG: MBL fold metallo-hydrolase, partial [Endomicrobiia bacterium]|nr:MBL fold metallo-hydrolase [Endomicrobiia bacterium]
RPKWNSNSATRITFISSEGECSLIEIPGYTNILIDAGGRWDPSRSAAAESYIPFLKTRNIRRLDAVFITGAELSRYGALEEIIREIPVTRVYVNHDISLWPEYISLMETLDKKRIPVIEIWAPWRMSARDFSIVALKAARLDFVPGRNAHRLMAKTAGARVYFAAGADDEFEERFAKRISDDDIVDTNNPRSVARGAVIVKIPRSGKGAAPIIIENLGADYAIINLKPDISMLSSANARAKRNTPSSGRRSDEGHRKKRFFLDETGAVEFEIRKDGKTEARALIKTRAITGSQKDDTKNQKNRGPLQFVQ